MSNLRPVRLFEGMETPLKKLEGGEIDFCVVRENNEGEYSNIGGRLYEGTEDELAVQQSVFHPARRQSRASLRLRARSHTEEST